MVLYKYMRKDKNEAIILRESGMSYSAIKERLGVPMSTLSNWFRDQKWSNEIARESARKVMRAGAVKFTVMNVARGNRLKKLYEDSKQDAFVDFDELRYHPLFNAGVVLYWCHGDKTSRHKVAFSSSDSRKIKVFVQFLTHICQAKKIKCSLTIDSEGNEPEIKDFWVQKGGLKPDYFGKSAYLDKKSYRKTGKSKLEHGVCNVVVNSAYLKSKILKWIELLAEEIAEEKYNNAGIV